jgi:hypothetical protein
MQVRFIIVCVATAEELTHKRSPEELASSAGLREISGFFAAVPKTSLVHAVLGFDAASYNKRQVRQKLQALTVSPVGVAVLL